MNILALDTSTKKAGVAIKKNDKIISKYIDNEITHSEKLLPLIDEVLNESKINLYEIDSLACVVGPGSFTGVRIGIATIKAFAKVINKKIVGVTSLKLMASEVIKENTSKYILALMDAKNGRVYFELFENKEGKLYSTSYFGNNLVKDVINEIENKNLEKLTIAIDNANLKDFINIPNIDIIKVNLNLENIFDIIDNESSFTYLDLDAKYYRKSEAERTKDGE